MKFNNLIYSPIELVNYLDNHQEIDTWQVSIFLFLAEWYNENDYIEVNTTGSTGTPKTIRLLKTSMINSALVTNEYFQLNTSTNALLCIPTEYIGGKMMIVRAIVGDFNLITVKPIANPFDSITESIDFAAITPYQLANSINTISTKNISKIIVGGAAIATELEIKTQQLTTKIFETYGMTETCSHIAIRNVNGANRSDYFQTLKNTSITTDIRGCLVIYAPHLSSNPFITNDIVEIINTDKFKILGRIDNIINTGGIKISPEQIERKLHGIINQNFFIAAFPDSKLSQKIVLIIENKEICKIDNHAIFQQLKNILHKYEIPKEIIVADSFCYATNGKLLRNETINKILTQNK